MHWDHIPVRQIGTSFAECWLRKVSCLQETPAIMTSLSWYFLSMLRVGNGLKKVGGGGDAKNSLLIILRSILSAVNRYGNVLFKFFFFFLAAGNRTKCCTWLSFEYMGGTLLYARQHGNIFLWYCFVFLEIKKAGRKWNPPILRDGNIMLLSIIFSAIHLFFATLLFSLSIYYELHVFAFVFLSFHYRSICSFSLVCLLLLVLQFYYHLATKSLHFYPTPFSFPWTFFYLHQCSFIGAYYASAIQSSQRLYCL